MKLMSKILTFFSLMILVPGCGVYTFTGDSIDYSTTKTISIQTFFNDSGNGPPSISQTLTEELKDYYQRNTKLSLVPIDGDIQIEGSIVSYRQSLVGASAASSRLDIDDAAQESLTITVKVSYINVQDDTFDFDKNFSWHAEYDPTQSEFLSIENDLVDEIIEQIVLDIFSASVANW